MYELISHDIKRYTRIVDHYYGSGVRDDSEQHLYMVDLNLQNISPPKNIAQKKKSTE